MNKLIYCKFSNERSNEFCIRTNIFQLEDGSKYVEKKQIYDEGKSHIESIYKNFEILSNQFKNTSWKPNYCTIKDGVLFFEFLKGKSLSEHLSELIQRNLIKQFWIELDNYVKHLKSINNTKKFCVTDEFIDVFGNVRLECDLDACIDLDIDLIFPNIILDNDIWNIIDYEWVFHFPVPINYVIYRGVSQFWNSLDSFGVTLEEVCEKYGISQEQINCYGEMEKNFQLYIRGMNKNVDYIAEKWYKEHLVNKEYFVKKLSLQVFYDYGEGIDEGNSERICYDNIAGRKNSFVLFVSKDVKQVRIDPCDASCILKIMTMSLVKEDFKKNMEYETNGIMFNNVIIYDSSDPEILLNCEQENDFVLFFEFSLHTFDEKVIDDIWCGVNKIKKEKADVIDKLENTDMKLKMTDEKLYCANQELEQLREELVSVRRELQGVYESKSWRMTRFFREISSIVRKG